MVSFSSFLFLSAVAAEAIFFFCTAALCRLHRLDAFRHFLLSAPTAEGERVNGTCCHGNSGAVPLFRRPPSAAIQTLLLAFLKKHSFSTEARRRLSVHPTFTFYRHLDWKDLEERENILAL